MSDTELSALESLKSRHRKEKKDLQTKITSIKHAVPKQDKKRKKEVQLEIESLEKALKERHDKEIELESKMESVKIEDSPVEMNEQNEKVKKLTKTQKQREKKAEAERKRALLVKMDEENAATSRGALETKKIKEILRENNLRLVDIKSDGDCLFNALAHQLNLVNSDSNSKFTGEFVRQTAANYMRNNSSEFLPFLDEEHANEYEGYCLRVEKPCQEGGDWGSATELKAASLALERPIKVINSDGLPHEFGEDFTSKPLTITFHRYLLTLGEHYNSTELIC